MSVLPVPILWAQRPEYVLLTVPLQDARKVRVELPNNGAQLKLSCTTPGADPTVAKDDRQYESCLDLFREVAAEESQHVVRPRQIEIKLRKKKDEADEEREWPRLTKEKTKLNNVQIDWNKWKDEDAEDDQADDLGDFGMGGGESGINYDDMVSQFMVKQSHDEAVAATGNTDIPKFGVAKGQQPLSEEEMKRIEESYDDMPPLEDDKDD